MRMSLFTIVSGFLVIFCLGNKEFIDINLGLNSFNNWTALTVNLPIFIVVLLATALGFLLGSISEFFRHRRRSNENRASLIGLKKDSEELRKLKSQKKGQKEELLSLLE